jgi:hypothetical protein
MPLSYLTVEKDRAGGAGAATIQFEVKSDAPIHELLLSMQFLEVTDMPTLAEVLTQLASSITVKSGGSSVFGMSATDLWHMMNLARAGGIAAHQSDATGADNAIMAITVPIPLGPLGTHHDVHPDYGLDPRNKTIIVELEIPADNALDARKYTLGFLSIDGKYPKKVVTRMTRNLTASATGDGQYIDLPSGPDAMLVDVAFFQTTALTAGTTSDVTGIESFSLEINQIETALVDIYGIQAQMNLRNLSLAASTPANPATYLYWNPNRPYSDEYSIPLPQKARININAGVAEALRFFGGITRNL